MILSLIILLRYLSSCFAIFSCVLMSFCENCETCWIDYARSGLIASIAYIKLSIMLWYSFCSAKTFIIVTLMSLAFIERGTLTDLLFCILYHSRIIRMYSIWLMWIIFRSLSRWIWISRKYLSSSRSFISYSFFNYILRTLMLIMFFSKIMRSFIHIMMIISVFVLM